MRTRSTAIVSVGIVLLALAAPADAHRADPWYPAVWRDPGNSVQWRFDRGVPRGGGIRRALKKGARRWDHLDQGLSFNHDRGEWNGYSPRRCTSLYQKNGVHWGPIDGPGGALAYTYTCVLTDPTGDPDTLYSFQIEFDSAENWNRNPNASPFLFETDLFGVAVHEFGHATGRISGGPNDDGHFAESSSLCPDIFTEDRHTMCPSTSGDGHARSLERHDRHVFRKAY